jgi:hypothetical protein
METDFVDFLKGLFTGILLGLLILKAYQMRRKK